MVCGTLEQNIDVLITQVHAIFSIYDTPVKIFWEKKEETFHTPENTVC